MDYRPLGTSSFKVSSLCLGTMTWGEQNSEKEAHAQLDLAFERGVNFIDTAEMYPVPPRAETYGATERYIGTWPKLKSVRDRIVLASKVVGPMPSAEFIRNGSSRLNREHITLALEESLKRLNVETIDLYQLHWPDRVANFFGQLEFPFERLSDEVLTPIEETLDVLKDLQAAGKIKEIGLSNETAYGVMKFLQIAKDKHAPRVQAIQNPYSLLNRSFEIGLSEIALREKVGLLAYSPLAFGVLTGKYAQGARPEGARLTRWERFSRYTNPIGLKATERYLELARRFNVSPTQLSLQFVTTRPFVTSTIIGATTVEQLEENLDSVKLVFTPEMLEAINEVHREISNPCP
jgi:aryl-alcohol dehydrogenase-like predicted oxidoreductase